MKRRERVFDVDVDVGQAIAQLVHGEHARVMLKQHPEGDPLRGVAVHVRDTRLERMFDVQALGVDEGAN